MNRLSRLALPCLLLAAIAQPAAADDIHKTIPVQPSVIERTGYASPLTDGWTTLGVGYYDAKDYKGGANPTAEGTQVGGGEAGLSINHAWLDTGVMLRLRASAYFDFTSNEADEIALLGGVALGRSRQLWLAAGLSRLSDVSNTRQSPTVGLPLELIWYPLSQLELALHGNYNDDRGFAGVTVGWAIGRQRPR